MKEQSVGLCCFWRVMRDVWPPQPSGGQWGFGELWGHPMNPLCCRPPKRNRGLAFKPLQHCLRKCVEMKKTTLGHLPLSNPLATAAHSRSLFPSIFRGFTFPYKHERYITIAKKKKKIICWNYVKIKPTKPTLNGKVVLPRKFRKRVNELWLFLHKFCCWKGKSWQLRTWENSALENGRKKERKTEI